MRGYLPLLIALGLLVCLAGVSFFTFQSATSFTDKLKAIIPPIVVLVLAILYFKYAEELIKSDVSTRLFGLALLILFIYLFWESGLINAITGKPAMVIGIDGIKWANIFTGIIKPAVIRGVQIQGNKLVVDAIGVVSSVMPTDHDVYAVSKNYVVDLTVSLLNEILVVTLKIDAKLVSPGYEHKIVLYHCNSVVMIAFGKVVNISGNCKITPISYSYNKGVHNFRFMLTIPVPQGISLQPPKLCSPVGVAILNNSYAILKLSCPVSSGYVFEIAGKSIKYEIYAVGSKAVYYKLFIPRDLALKYRTIKVIGGSPYPYTIHFSVYSVEKPSNEYKIYKKKLEEVYKEYTDKVKEFEKLKQENASQQEILQLQKQIEELQKQIEELETKLSSTKGPTTDQLVDFLQKHAIECMIAMLIIAVLLSDLISRRRK